MKEKVRSKMKRSLKLTITSLLMLSLLLIITVPLFGQLRNHFQTCWSGNPYNAMTIFISSATADGTDLGAGDEIGIFDGDLCVAADVLTGVISGTNLFQMAASADNPITVGIIDGFIDGHAISYKLWDSSENCEYTNVTPTYALGDGTFSQLGTALGGLAGTLLPGTIEGTVTLSGGTEVVTNVEVTAGGVTVHPDTYGDYVITLQPGTYNVVATLTNYTDSTVAGVVVLENQATTGIDFILDPLPGSIFGTVTLANRVGNITDVEITAGGITVNPDSNGDYTIDGLAPGTYDVTASLPNYQSSTQTDIVVVENTNTPDVDFTLVALPGTIEGTVTLSGGTEVVTNVEVTAGGVTVNPDTNGDYLITLQPGTYDVVTTLTNYADSTIVEVEVLENQATTGVDFTLEPLPGSISGTVTLANRAGNITDVEVTAGGQTVNPDTNGDYTIDGLAPGTYDVTASLTNYQSSTQYGVVVVENQDTPNIDFTLVALPGTIEGTVTLSGGTEVVTNVEVTAGGVTVNPDTNGDYLITLQPGTYDVVTTLTNYADSTIVEVEVLENQATTGVDFTLEPLPGSISGTVTLANRVGNITDVEITAGGITVNPDSNGDYTIDGLAPGTYDVIASLPNYQSSTQTDIVVVENQNTPNVDFTLVALPGTIEGTVTLSGGTEVVTNVEVTAGGITVNPDTNGDYVISLQPGTYNVVATLTNYADSTIVGVEVLENQATTGIDFTLDPLPGSISGTVILNGGAGEVNEVDVSAGGVTVNPNAIGDYTITGLTPGTYNVIASLIYYDDSTNVDVVVNENQNTPDIDFTLYPQYGAIEGTITVTGGSGNVEDVMVVANGYTTNPNDTGYYLLDGVFPGTYDVTATLTGYPSSTIEDVEVLPLQTTSNIDLTLIFGPPVVDFAATPDSGCAPLDVQFTDLSTNEPTSWLWDFGDGNTSTEQNPSNTYTDAGMYDITLSATNAAGTNTLMKNNFIKAGKAPVAEFVANTTSGCAPLLVLFMNQTVQSSGFVTSWLWDFGDGGTSTSQGPSHNYQTPGTYTVSLTATNSCGSDTEVKEDYITVYSAPEADFSGTPTYGCGSLQVQFTDLSTNNPTSWLWDFGDGSTSVDQNPSHEYTDWGAYTVSLTATNSCGSDTETKVDYIILNGIPIADAGVDQTVYDNETVYLDGSGSYDPEGEDLNYHWVAPVGIVLSDSTIVDPTFFAPDIDDPTDFEFVLTVDDGECYSEPDTVVITVINNPVSVNEIYPNEFELIGSYPNPIRDRVEISFGIPEKSNIRIELYDIRGHFVEILMNKDMNAGYQKVECYMSNLKNGIYFYKMSVGGVDKEIKKMILLR